MSGPERPLTVVVTCRNSARTLERCLRSVRARSGAPVELVVVDNHSTDTSTAIARRFADRVLVAGPERSAQRNAGAAAATAPAVLFVDSDMVLEPGVTDQVVALLATTGCSGVVVPERSFGQGFWARCKALEKRLALGDPAVEAARGFRRHQLLASGGYDEDLTACEDWELADRMSARLGAPPARTDAGIWHDEGRLRLRGTVAKKRYYGRWVRRWMDGRPDHRRRGASTLVSALASQPVVGAGLIVLKAAEGAGFLMGMRDARRAGR